MRKIILGIVFFVLILINNIHADVKTYNSNPSDSFSTLTTGAKQRPPEEFSLSRRTAKKDNEVENQKLIIEERTSLIYLFASIILLITIYVFLRNRNIRLLREKNDKLAKLIDNRDKLFSIIAHDLRSPFSGIFGFTDFLISSLKSKDYDTALEMGTRLREISYNVYELLENLLEWAEVQRDRLTAQPKNLSLAKCIESAESVFRAKAEQKQLILETLIPEGMGIYADDHMLDIVLRNLISNSIKFTERCGKITVQAKENGSNVEVLVKDTGIGIPQTIASNLFTNSDSIKRKGTEEEPSTGLGLILCKEYIERNGGSLCFESVPQEGTSFYFTVPKARNSVNNK